MEGNGSQVDNQGELLERERERGQIAAAVERAAAGTGSTLLIEGVPGIGKSALLGEAAAIADANGFTVLSASGGELEREIPFGVARQLFERTLRELPANEAQALLGGAAAPAAEALGEAGGNDGLGGRETEAASVVHGLYRLTLNLAERGPLLLSIDDGQWADSASLRFAAYLSRRLRGENLLLLVASRPDATQSGPLALLAGDPETLTLVPSSLSEQAVATMVRFRHGEQAPQEFCRACHEAGGGNPFLTTALLVALEQDAIAADDSAVDRVRAITPKAITRSVTGRLAQLPRAASRLCAALAVLGRSGELRHAAVLADADAEDAAETAEALSRAGLLAARRPLEFAHPVIREVVYGELGQARRAAMHRRAAELLAGEGAEPEVVAMHLLECERTGDRWVAAGLREGAARALGRGAADIAADLLERALAEPPPREERAALLHALGGAEVLAGRIAGIEHLAAAETETENLERALAIGVELAWAQGLFGQVEVAIATLERVLERAHREGAGYESVLAIEAELATVSATATTDQDRGALERLAAGLDRESDEELVLCACLAFARAKDCEPAAEVAELALSTLGEGGLLSRRGPVSLALFYASMTLLACGRYEDAEREIEAALAVGRASNAIWGLGSQHYLRSHLGYLRGDLAEAELDARTSLEVAESHGYLIGIPASLSAWVLALVELGELDKAATAFGERGLNAELPPLSTFSFLLEARGRLHAARGEHAEALADLLEAGERYGAWGVRNPALGAWRSAAALSAAALGENERATELVADDVRLAREFGAPRAIGVTRGAAALLEADRDASIAGLRDACEVLAGSGAALEHARALVDLGAAVRRSGKRKDAREPLRVGLDIAVRTGATPLADRARTELEACGARPRSVVLSGSDSLTPSERRVATLAAAGRSNREIAETLFVTRKTVEYHLTGAYRKLEIDSREELAAALEA